jgi:hypothetical protein
VSGVDGGAAARVELEGVECCLELRLAAQAVRHRGAASLTASAATSARGFETAMPSIRT